MLIAGAAGRDGRITAVRAAAAVEALVVAVGSAQIAAERPDQHVERRQGLGLARPFGIVGSLPLKAMMLPVAAW